MSKQLPKEEAKELLNDLHKPKTKNTTWAKDAWLFARRLSGALFGLSILGLGAYAVYLGYNETDVAIKQIALYISGSCAAVNGLVATFYALVRMK